MRKRSLDPALVGPPVYYQAALDELGVTVREARALAELLDQFAGLFRGKQSSTEGPPVEAFPTPAEVRRALDRRQRAMEAAEREWERLPSDLCECWPRPGELLEGD
jgi:hypothetical protein